MRKNLFFEIMVLPNSLQSYSFLSDFLKVLSSFMSILEPFILGLAITELTANLVDMAKGVSGAELNVPYIAGILIIYFSEVFSMN